MEEQFDTLSLSEFLSIINQKIDFDMLKLAVDRAIGGGKGAEIVTDDVERNIECYKVHFVTAAKIEKLEGVGLTGNGFDETGLVNTLLIPAGTILELTITKLQLDTSIATGITDPLVIMYKK